MKLVFLAGPFRGDGGEESKNELIGKARDWVRKLIEADIPFYSPHLNLSQETMRYGLEKEAYAMACQEAFLDKCDILAVMPGFEESAGTQEEIEFAKAKKMPIVYLEEPEALEELKKLTA